jgi:hypothetical protein
LSSDGAFSSPPSHFSPSSPRKTRWDCKDLQNYGHLLIGFRPYSFDCNIFGFGFFIDFFFDVIP